MYCCARTCSETRYPKRIKSQTHEDCARLNLSTGSGATAHCLAGETWAFPVNQCHFYLLVIALKQSRQNLGINYVLLCVDAPFGRLRRIELLKCRVGIEMVVELSVSAADQLRAIYLADALAPSGPFNQFHHRLTGPRKSINSIACLSCFLRKSTLKPRGAAHLTRAPSKF